MNTEEQPGPDGQSNQLAFIFVQQLATELSRGIVELPSFPKAVIQVQRALADPASSVDRISQIVGEEPGLAARLMGIANSAAYNSGQPLTNLHSAVMRWGVIWSAALQSPMH